MSVPEQFYEDRGCCVPQREELTSCCSRPPVARHYLDSEDATAAAVAAVAATAAVEPDTEKDERNKSRDACGITHQTPLTAYLEVLSWTLLELRDNDLIPRPTLEALLELFPHRALNC